MVGLGSSRCVYSDGIDGKKPCRIPFGVTSEEIGGGRID